MSLWQGIRRALGLSPPELVAPEDPPSKDSRGGPDGSTAEELLLERSEPSGPRAKGRERNIHEVVGRLVLLGRVDRAIEFLGHQVSIGRPVDDGLILLLGELLYTKGEAARAVPVLRRVLTLPTPLQQRLRAHYLLAECLVDTDDREGARGELCAILAEDLDYPCARTRLTQLGPSSVRIVDEKKGLFPEGSGDGGGVGQALPTLLPASQVL